MFRSILLGRPFGIGTYIHWSFWLLILFVALQNLRFGLATTLFTITLVFSVFACVVLHEFGHALMARRFGIQTRDIYLYPIGGVARLERMPENPLQELLIALAGPAVNVGIAGVLVVFLGLDAVLAEPGQIPDLRLTVGSFVMWLLAINIFLVIFNMLPAFPMDGGRVFRSLLAIKLPYLRATEIAAVVGKYLAFALGVWGLINFNFFLCILALFVYASGQQELFMVRQRHGMPVRMVFGGNDAIDVTRRGGYD